MSFCIKTIVKLYHIVKNKKESCTIIQLASLQILIVQAGHHLDI